MARKRMLTGILLVISFTIAHATETNPEMDRQNDWNYPHECGAFVDGKAEPPTYMFSISEMSTRFLKLTLSLGGTNPWTKLTLQHACRMLRVPLARTQTLSPVEPSPQSRFYQAILSNPSRDTTLFLEYYDGPENRTIQFSISTSYDPEPFSPGILHADMGAACQVRAQDVSNILTEAGYVMRMVGFDSPPKDVWADHGPRIIFDSPRIDFAVDLQGTYQSQRAKKLESCVARMEAFVRNNAE